MVPVDRWNITPNDVMLSEAKHLLSFVQVGDKQILR